MTKCADSELKTVLLSPLNWTRYPSTHMRLLTVDMVIENSIFVSFAALVVTDRSGNTDMLEQLSGPSKMHLKKQPENYG